MELHPKAKVERAACRRAEAIEGRRACERRRTSRELELDLRDAEPKCWAAKNVVRGFGRPAIPPSPSPQFPEPHPLTHRARRPWLCGATFLCASGRPQRRDVEGKEGRGGKKEDGKKGGKKEEKKEKKKGGGFFGKKK